MLRTGISLNRNAMHLSICLFQSVNMNFLTMLHHIIANQRRRWFARPLLFIFAVVMISSNASAQQKSLSGVVFDSVAHTAVIGATIQLVPGSYTDISDENGKFFYKTVPAVANTISIFASGYKKQEISLSDF